MTNAGVPDSVRHTIQMTKEYVNLFESTNSIYVERLHQLLCKELPKGVEEMVHKT